MTGTPQNLDQLFMNIVDEMNTAVPDRVKGGVCLADLIIFRKHVQDYIANSVAPHVLNDSVAPVAETALKIRARMLGMTEGK